MGKSLAHNLQQTLIAIDQVVYCLGGTLLSLFNAKVKVYADLTISAQAYRLSKRGVWYGKALEAFINALFYCFERDHCLKAFISEQTGRHLPPDIK